MAVVTDTLILELQAKLDSYNTNVKAAQDRFERFTSQITSSAQRAERATSQMGQRIGAAIGTIASVLGANEIKQYADAWTEAGNKIRAAAASAGVQVRSLEELRAGADGARQSFSDYADLYAKLIRSSSGLAKNEEEIARVTRTVALAMKAGGAATSEQTSAILQLGQALGSGVLQGDELRSLRENAPILAQAIADEFKVTIGGLKELGEEGKITADRVFKAILNAQAKVEGQFSKTNATIADGFTLLKNAVTQYIGQMNELNGISATIGSIMAALAGNIEHVAAAAAAAGLVLLGVFSKVAAAGVLMVATNPFLLLLTGITAATFAVSKFGDQIKLIEGQAATVRDYVGAVWDTIKETAASVSAAVISAFTTLFNFISTTLTGSATTWESFWTTVRGILNNLVNGVEVAYDLVRISFSKLPAAIGESVVNAMNAMVAGVEGGLNAVISKMNGFLTSLDSIMTKIPGVMASNRFIPLLEIPRITSQFAGAGEKAGVAYGDAFNKMTRDRIGQGLGAISGRANQRASEREQNIAMGDYGSPVPIGLGGAGTAGFGGFKPKKEDESGGGKKKLDAYQREIQQIQERTALLKAETAAQASLNPLINDYGFAVAYAQQKQELLNAAKKANITVTPEMTANIHKLAEAYATAVVESAKLAEAQARVVEMAREFNDLSKDVAKSFINDIRSGKSILESFGNSLNKIADKLVEMAATNLFENALGGKKGGGLFGFLGSLFSPGKSSGGGGVGALTQLFSRGGYTGPGNPADVAGLVHKKEVVWSDEDTQRWGGAGVVDAMRRGSMPVVAVPTPAHGGTGDVYVSVAPVFDNRGAGPDVIAATAQQIANLKAEMPSIVAKSVKEGRTQRIIR